MLSAPQSFAAVWPAIVHLVAVTGAAVGDLHLGVSTPFLLALLHFQIHVIFQQSPAVKRLVWR